MRVAAAQSTETLESAMQAVAEENKKILADKARFFLFLFSSFCFTCTFF